MALDSTINLVSLADLTAFLGDVPKVNGLWIYSDGTGTVTVATVEVTDTTMVLTITGGGDAGPATITFADTDSDTLSELITKINDVAGWKSGAIYHGSADSTDLVVIGALSAIGSANEQVLRMEANYTLNDWINRISRLVERYCQRKFKSRTYTREIYLGSGTEYLALENYPVTRVIRVAEGRTNAFDIYNTSTDANFMTVEITSTVMRLVVDGGSSDDDTSLTLSSYATIDALIAAIPSKGWATNTISSNTNTIDASELLPRPSMYVDATTRCYAEIPDEHLTDYQLLKPSEDRNEGILYRPSGFTKGIEYFCDYVGGFSTIPYDLQLIAFEGIKYKLDQLAISQGMKKEVMADYAYEKFDIRDMQGFLNANPDLKAQLDMFKQRII